MPFDDPANLARWEPRVRACAIDSEVFSRLGFTVSTSGGVKRVSVQHLAQSSASPAYKPLVEMTRPDESTFKRQLEFLDRYAELRGDRGPEILAGMPGAIAFFAAIGFVNPDRTPKTIELLDAANRLAVYVEMRFKHVLACRRPLEYSPQVQPMIPTPAHSAFPSGHSTESFTAALVLWMLLRDAGIAPYRDVMWGDQFMLQASRIAVNRTVAGLHFPIDSAAGCMLGLTLGRYFVNRATAAPSYEAWTFDSAKFPDGTSDDPRLDGDFYWRSLYSVDAKPNPKQIGPAAPNDYAASAGVQTIGGDSPMLEWLWNKAKAEWS